MKAYDDPPPMPADVTADIERGERAFAEHGRFVIPDAAGTASATPAEKVEHFRCSIFNGLAQWTKETGGQPPMVARFRSATIMVGWLEKQGIPFAVSRTSRMNKELRRLLNERAATSEDPRKSRWKQITPDAVRVLLQKIKQLRFLTEHFIRIRPYSD
jgi:hypothetical protein